MKINRIRNISLLIDIPVAITSIDLLEIRIYFLSQIFRECSENIRHFNQSCTRILSAKNMFGIKNDNDADS